MGYGYLFAAIVAEVIATSALKAAEGFTVLLPSVAVVFGYVAAFYFLSWLCIPFQWGLLMQYGLVPASF